MCIKFISLIKFENRELILEEVGLVFTYKERTQIVYVKTI